MTTEVRKELEEIESKIKKSEAWQEQLFHIFEESEFEKLRSFGLNIRDYKDDALSFINFQLHSYMH